MYSEEYKNQFSFLLKTLTCLKGLDDFGAQPSYAAFLSSTSR